MFPLQKHKQFFITGTNTGVGKTFWTCKLLDYFNEKGLNTLGLKPIASGATPSHSGLRNEDALLLQQHSRLKLPYETINPIVFEPPIAPHIAAEKINSNLSVNYILEKLEPGLTAASDLTLVEGAGGLMVPLSMEETLVDLIKALNLPIILVVHMTLGCLNHALLTYDFIKNHELPFFGWIGNTIGEPMPAFHENLKTLSSYFKMQALNH